MLPGRCTCFVARLVGLAGLLACRDTSARESTVKLRAVLDAASQRLTLSHSPNAVADGKVIALPLAAIPFPSTFDDSIQHVTDVASWTDGTVAVLDRVQHHILILDRERAVVRTLGRQGNGPGEFQN